MKLHGLLLMCILMSLSARMFATSGGDAQAGRVVYEKNCGTCHGATGQGTPTLVKASKSELQDRYSRVVQSRTDELLAKDTAGGTAQKRALQPLQEKQ